MSNTIHCDLAIIGAGSGGLSLAAGASQLGLRVVLLEKGLMGGDCLNYGCVPSKSLLAAAKRYWQARHGETFGFTAKNISLDFKQVMAHVRDVIDTIAVHDSVERFTALGVKVIQAKGAFIDAKTIQAGDHLIQAKKMVIAVGSSPAVPPIPGVNEVSYLTNETIFELDTQPEHLIVVGGGPIGCEMAQAFAMLGSQVTLIEAFHVLTNDEPEAAAIVKQALRDSGVSLYEQAAVGKIEKDEKGHVSVHVTHDGHPLEIKGSHLLIAAGRKPNIEGIGCEKAGIQTDKRGIIVDDRLRSSNKHIFAIGDAAGRLQFTHVAGDHAGIVLKQVAFKLPAKFNDKAIPKVTYTSPEIAQVGLTEKQLIEKGEHPVVTTFEYKGNDRAQAEAQTKGMIKVMTNKKGKILGVSIVGAEAGELLFPWVIALREGKTLRFFTDSVAAYPTLSEISKRVAGQFYAPKLFSPGVKKLVRFLSKF